MNDRSSTHPMPSDEASRAAADEAVARGDADSVAAAPPEEALGDSQTQRGHLYQATVTAHFPDQASLGRAREALEQLNLPPETHSTQWLVKAVAPAEWGDQQPGLAPGVTALILQLADATRGPEIVRLCEEAGSTQATFYAAQQMTW